jgi:hypothetical protein
VPLNALLFKAAAAETLEEERASFSLKKDHRNCERHSFVILLILLILFFIKHLNPICND